MVAYLIFIKERTHNQGELDLYKEMAPAALAGHPITFRIAHGHKKVVKGPGLRGRDGAGISNLSGGESLV
jgi:hypothetical protein